jgi:hypothetical protein
LIFVSVLYLVSHFKMVFRIVFTIMYLCHFQWMNGQTLSMNLEVGHLFGFNNQTQPIESGIVSKPYSLGGGVYNQLTFKIQPDSANWHFGLGLNSLFGNNTIVYKQTNSAKTEADVIGRKTNSLRFVGLLGVDFKVSSLQFNVYSGLIIPLLNQSTQERNQKKDTQFFNYQYKNKHYFAIGYTGGVRITKPINDKISLFFNCQTIILNQKIRSQELRSYNDYLNRDLQTVFPDKALRSSIYQKDIFDIKNNESVFPDLYNKDKATDLLSYSESFNALGFSIGVNIKF